MSAPPLETLALAALLVPLLEDRAVFLWTHVLLLKRCFFGLLRFLCFFLGLPSGHLRCLLVLHELNILLTGRKRISRLLLSLLFLLLLVLALLFLISFGVLRVSTGCCYASTLFRLHLLEGFDFFFGEGYFFPFFEVLLAGGLGLCPGLSLPFFGLFTDFEGLICRFLYLLDALFNLLFFYGPPFVVCFGLFQFLFERISFGFLLLFLAFDDALHFLLVKAATCTVLGSLRHFSVSRSSFSPLDSFSFPHSNFFCSLNRLLLFSLGFPFTGISSCFLDCLLSRIFDHFEVLHGFSLLLSEQSGFPLSIYFGSFQRSFSPLLPLLSPRCGLPEIICFFIGLFFGPYLVGNTGLILSKFFCCRDGLLYGLSLCFSIKSCLFFGSICAFEIVRFALLRSLA